MALNSYSYLIRIICSKLYDFKYSYLIKIICSQSDAFKFSYPIQIICSQLDDFKYSYGIQIISSHGQGINREFRLHWGSIEKVISNRQLDFTAEGDEPLGECNKLNVLILIGIAFNFTTNNTFDLIDN